MTVERRVQKRLRGAIVLLAVVLIASLAPPAPVAAQTELASQSLGRGYWHMFVAYALGWIVILGWMVSIARRLARIERRLEE